MDTDLVISLAVAAMELALKVALPLLLVGLAVGLVISVFQAVTQIQEQTLTFIPKILATVAVMVIGGPWMLDQLLSYTRDLWASIPELVRLGASLPLL
jgi:flagellar biosynthetic protein FliQ